jgi:DNA-directed RNA polymerase specialized sigma24 family protein
MKRRRARLDALVARYYPAVYRFASRLTDDPREAVLLTHQAFTTTRKQLRNRRNEAEFKTTLLDAVIRGGAFSPLESSLRLQLDKRKMARCI